MPLFFYFTKFVFKKNIAILNIFSFFITAFIPLFCCYYLVFNGYSTFTKKYFSLLVIFIIFSIYLLSTLLPFKFFIFKDPLTNKYGINGHK